MLRTQNKGLYDAGTNNRVFVRVPAPGFLRYPLYLLKPGNRAVLLLCGGLDLITFDLLVERYKESSPYPEKPISQRNRNPSPEKTRDPESFNDEVFKIRNPNPVRTAFSRAAESNILEETTKVCTYRGTENQVGKACTKN